MSHPRVLKRIGLVVFIAVFLFGCGGGSSSGDGEDHMAKFVTRGTSANDYHFWGCVARSGSVTMAASLILVDNGRGAAFFGLGNDNDDETLELSGTITDWDASSSRLTIKIDVDDSDENATLIFDRYTFSGDNTWRSEFRLEEFSDLDGRFSPECRLLDQDGNLV